MSEIAALVGPFYDTEGISRLLNVPTEAVQALRDTGELLGMETADHRWVYPVFQITGTTVNPDLLPAIRHLSNAPGWSKGLWFLTPNPELDKMTPLEWLRADLPAANIARAAGHIAAQWAA